MSRIHDALRRAERSGQTASEPVLDILADALPATNDAPQTSFPSVEAEVALTGSSPEAAVTTNPDPALAKFREQEWTPNRSQVLFVQGDSSRSAEQEQFRTLRSRLLQIRAQQPLKTLLVTSALPGEGKTFVAANLAVVLARQHGRRVLLVDGDLRRPRLHELLGAPATPGLADYLAASADESAVIQSGPLQNLYFMPSGTTTSNPSELIGTGAMARLISHTKPLFDWVIVDSPPVIPVSDATQMAEACDGVLLVLRAGSTAYDIAQRAKDEFRRTPVVGVVLNRTGKDHGDGVYYYELYGNETVANGRKG